MGTIKCKTSSVIAKKTIAYNTFLEGGAEDVSLVDGGNFGHVACASLAIIGGKIWIDVMAEICEPESVGILDFNPSKDRELIGIFDLLGRSVDNIERQGFYLHIFEDGSVKKVYLLD